MTARRTRRDFLQHSSRLLAGGALAGLAGCGESQPAAEVDGRPNLLFFFPDQQRPDWLGLGGNAVWRLFARRTSTAWPATASTSPAQ